jgi:hypothetical protein
MSIYLSLPISQISPAVYLVVCRIGNKSCSLYHYHHTLFFSFMVSCGAMTLFASLPNVIRHKERGRRHTTNEGATFYEAMQIKYVLCISMFLGLPQDDSRDSKAWLGFSVPWLDDYRLDGSYQVLSEYHPRMHGDQLTSYRVLLTQDLSILWYMYKNKWPGGAFNSVPAK